MYFRHVQKVNCPKGAREAPLEGAAAKIIEIPEATLLWKKSK